MLFILVTIVIICLVFGPHLWVKNTLHRYSDPIPSLPGTGGELALHLLNRLNIQNVRVEPGNEGENYYDPIHKIIRLAPDIYDKKSLTAITISAHEVGHAIQDHIAYPPLIVRTRLSHIASILEKIAAGLLISVPFIALLTKIPQVGIITFLSGITLLALPVILHFVTLPVEFDASFKRALPILQQGEYLPDSALPVAHKILTAAALTYVSASLLSLLNFYRWIAILRR